MAFMTQKWRLQRTVPNGKHWLFTMCAEHEDKKKNPTEWRFLSV